MSFSFYSIISPLFRRSIVSLKPITIWSYLEENLSSFYISVLYVVTQKDIQVTSLANSLWYLFCMKRDWPILTPFFHYSVKHNKRWQQHKDFLFRQLGIITVLSTVCNPFFYLRPFENTIIEQDTVLWCCKHLF